MSKCKGLGNPNELVTAYSAQHRYIENEGTGLYYYQAWHYPRPGAMGRIRMRMWMGIRCSIGIRMASTVGLSLVKTLPTLLRVSVIR